MSSCSPQSYIHGSSQAQFVAESHIILLLSILYVERESVIMQFIQVGWYQRCRQNCFSRIFFFPPVLSLMSRHDTFIHSGHHFRVKVSLKWFQRGRTRGDSGEKRNMSCFLSPAMMEASTPLLLNFVPLTRVLQATLPLKKCSRTEHPNILICLWHKIYCIIYTPPYNLRHMFMTGDWIVRKETLFLMRT